MNEFQYCYWLMGIFEIGNVQSLDAKKIYLVKEHLNLVTYREHNFCNWLEGYLDASSQQYLDNNKTSKILEKLRLEFLNVIDKSYPQQLWEKLQQAHDGQDVVIIEEEVKKQKIETVKESPKFEALC